MNRPDAITVLVKPNLRWLVRGHDGWSCTFVLPIGFDRLLVIAASLPVASLHQIYRDAPMYPASPIEGHSLQWGVRLSAAHFAGWELRPTSERELSRLFVLPRIPHVAMVSRERIAPARPRHASPRPSRAMPDC